MEDGERPGPSILPLPSSRRSWWWGVALVGLTVITYLPVMRNGWIWDDDFYVTENSALRSAAGLWRIWTELGAVPQYYPLTHTTFWVEYHLWGLWPAGYHLDNVLLHAANVLLIWWLLRKLEVRGAWLAAAIFAVHPVHVESVGWVTERKNVLSGVFYLLAMGAYWGRGFGNANTDDPPIRRGWILYFAALLAFVCALLSKSVASTWPAAILLVIWWKRGRIRWRDVWPMLPFVVVGAAMGAITSWMEKFNVGASGPDWNFHPADRLLIAGRAVWFYAGKLAWPVPMIFEYDRWQVDRSDLLQWIYPAVALVVLIGLWAMRRRLGRGPLVGALFFVGTLTPALGFFDLWPMRYSFVADHFQYLASVGLIVLAASVLWRWRMVAALVVLALVVLSWRAERSYANAETLWRDTLAKNPDAWMAENNYGLILMGRGEVAEAERQFRRSLAIYPNAPETVRNLGLLLAARGDWAGAAEQYEREVQLEDADASYQFTRGAEEAERRRTFLAWSYRWAGERRAGRRAAARSDLATALVKLGRLREAETVLVTAAELDSSNGEVWNTLGNVWAKGGQPDRAMGAFEKAAKGTPESAAPWNNIGLLLMGQGRFAEAASAFEKAVKIKPDYEVAKRNLEGARSRAVQNGGG